MDFWYPNSSHFFQCTCQHIVTCIHSHTTTIQMFNSWLSHSYSSVIHYIIMFQCIHMNKSQSYTKHYPISYITLKGFFVSEQQSFLPVHVPAYSHLYT